MPFKNFSLWRGRLPHWRADDVTYYVQFSHRRPFSPEECGALLVALMRGEGSKVNFEIIAALPERTQMILRVSEAAREGFEFADFIEAAKSKTSKKVMKRTGERFPPLYQESYDRIIRDESEYEEFWLQILNGPVDAELVEDPGEWPGFWALDEPRTP